jgi:hypothetical protein
MVSTTAAEDQSIQDGPQRGLPRLLVSGRRRQNHLDLDAHLIYRLKINTSACCLRPFAHALQA